MKYFTAFVLLSLIGILLPLTSQAQFIGLGADLPISYSKSDEKPTGLFVQLTHTTPFLPNFNMGFFTMKKKFEGQDNDSHTLNVSGTVSLLEFFYHVPVPFLSFGIGLGGGNFLTSTKIQQNTLVLQKVNQSKYVGSWFMQLGLPLWNTIEIHASYHQVLASGYKLIKKSDIELKGIQNTQNLSGALTAVGFQIAF